MADDLLSAAEIEVLTGKRPPPVVVALDPRLTARLEAIHERAARQFAAELSSLLRRTVHVRLCGAASVSSADYITRLEPAAYYRRIVAAPLAEPWLLSISPDTLYSIVDCMLGGGRDAQAKVRRPPTNIELRLIGRATNLFLEALQSAWQGTTALELRILDEEAHAQAAGSPQASTLHSMQFVLEFAGARGELSLGVPESVLSDLLTSPNERAAATERQPAACDGHQETVELVACLAETEIAPDDLASLAVGDIITTEQSAASPIAVSQNGELRFHAHLGSRRGHKAIEIEHVLPNEDRARDTGA